MTRRQRRLLKKQERERGSAQGHRRGVNIRASYIIGFFVIIGIAFLTYWISKGSSDTSQNNQNETYTATPVHWHANFEVSLCGQKQDFSSYGAVQHAGSPLLHTHGDGVVHIEGRIIKKEDIALGKFFDGINIPFDRDRIMDKKNGDECEPGKPGVVKMFVNGEPKEQFRDYIPAATENGKDQVIHIVFE